MSRQPKPPVGGLRAYQEARRAASEASILEAAATLFIANGYAATSIAKIAAAAQVSPATVYKAFGTKEALFKAMLRAETEATRPPVQAVAAAFTRPEDAARAIAAMFRAALTTSRLPGLARLVAAEQAQFDLADLRDVLVDDQGKERGQAYGEELLSALIERGLFRPCDVEFAVRQFVGMLNQAIVVEPQTTGALPDRLDAYIEDCVQLFCARYGARDDDAAAG